MELLQLDTHVGFHGKIPARGDFVQRGLPASFVQLWDGWLQASMAQSKEMLGDSWLDAYLTCPIWRFVLTPGVIGDFMWVGAIMPSVDRVNRYFPLTIAGSLATQIPTLSVADACDEWFERTEQLLIHALEDDHLDLDEYTASVCGHEFSLSVETSTCEKAPLSSGPVSFSIVEKANVLTNCSSLFEGLAHNHFGDFSLWITNGSENVAPQGRLCSGLPDASQFASFLLDH